MKKIFITISSFFYFLLEKKWKFLMFMTLSIVISISHSLLALPKYTAQASFEVDSSWDDWWLLERNGLNISNISSFKTILSKDNKYKFEQMIKSPKMIMSFLEVNNFHEDSYFYNYKYNRTKVLRDFRLNLSIGKDRITNIFYITLSDKNNQLAEDNLNDYLHYLNQKLIELENKNIDFSINTLQELSQTNTSNGLQKDIENRLIDKKISKELISSEVKPPLKIIDNAYSSVFRTYPKRGSTVIFLSIFAGLSFIILFMEPKSKKDR